jgi:hypothetical protein
VLTPLRWFVSWDTPLIVPASGKYGIWAFKFAAPPCQNFRLPEPFCPTPRDLAASACVCWAAIVLALAASRTLPVIFCNPGICNGGPDVATKRPVESGVKVAILMYWTEITQMSGLTSIKIQALVRDMDTSMRRHKGLKRTNAIEYRKKIEQENPVLYEQFPSVYEMHIEGNLDETFFEMLKLRQKIEKGEITEDDASKIVGQKLFDRYVAPVVNKLPTPDKPISYNEYYKQFENPPSSEQ